MNDDTVQLLVAAGALKFGEFTLKSSRTSPYFFDLGACNGGAAMAALGEQYARFIGAMGIAFDMLFGPAYKGIPLVTATAIAWARQGRDLPFAFNRKEAKKYGEGGSLVGARLAGRVLILDDLITAGTAVRDSLDLIRNAGAEPAGVVVALDRQERGPGGMAAMAELETELGVPVRALTNLDAIVAHLQRRGDRAAELEAICNYRDRYGAISQRP